MDNQNQNGLSPQDSPIVKKIKSGAKFRFRDYTDEIRWYPSDPVGYLVLEPNKHLCSISHFTDKAIHGYNFTLGFRTEFLFKFNEITFI